MFLQVNGITGETFHYSDVYDIVHRVASGLSRLGVPHGDVIACFSPNSHDYIFVLFAAMCNGAPVALINPSYTACELILLLLLLLLTVFQLASLYRVITGKASL